MSQFWLGMFCIPAAAWAIFCVYSAVLGLIWVSERVDLSAWKIWPKNPDDRLRNRLPLTATVACAKWVRYFWVPGWHVVICRTTLANKCDDEQFARHRRVERAVEEALGADAIDV